MGSNIDNRNGVPCSASLPLPKSSPCKTMPLVFMTRGEREARSSKFYPGALRVADHPAGITPIEVWIPPLVRTLEYLIGHEPSRAHHTARAVRINFAAEVHAFRHWRQYYSVTHHISSSSV